jgi:hypothetical protein
MQKGKVEILVNDQGELFFGSFLVGVRRMLILFPRKPNYPVIRGFYR